MKCYVALGSNLGNRLENLELAANALSLDDKVLRASPVYQNKALVPPGAPLDWNLAFLNAVLEVETSSSPFEFLARLKKIEKHLGRQPAERWAPRVIDLDLILWGSEILSTPELQVPHPEMWDRSFVLDPLKDLVPQLIPPGKTETVLSRSRKLPGHLPLWMGILNLTPDSFSDGGKLSDPSAFDQKVEDWIRAGVHVLDVGAESTRPGATPLEPEQEWTRLADPLQRLLQKIKGRVFRPRVSVDSRHVSVQERAFSLGADWLNDVTGLSDPRMAQFVDSENAKKVAGTFRGVFMHSLTVPADKNVVLSPDVDPISYLKAWALLRIEKLCQQGWNMEQLIFDPGIGFGKTELQSLEILKRAQEFQDLPVPVLIGHSRKSFMRLWTGEKPVQRDGDSVGLSLRLISSGVDILRVHEAPLHMGAHLAWSHL